jgi:hypothetical protein
VNDIYLKLSGNRIALQGDLDVVIGDKAVALRRFGFGLIWPLANLKEVYSI